MLSSPRQQLWQLRLLNLLAICGVFIAWIGSARAQIIPDGTLGGESATLKPNANVQGLPATLIEGGATRGVNLFQSFLQFNVGDSQRIYFANPAGIENIWTRVTGSDRSNIFGTLGVDGRANLFLLNPNGIIFGPNARLDVAGSFLATTANSFVFDNGLKFSATNPEAAPLLTVSIRPGLQFGANHPASISNTGNLTTGQNLSLIAGNLDLQGRLQAGKDLTLQAQDTVKLQDTTANPLIVAAGGKLLIQGNQNIDIFALNHPDSGLFAGGDMVLRSANTVGGDAHYWSRGNFRIEKLDSSLGKLSSPNDPIIRASGDVSFDSYEGASLHIFAGGSVNIDSIFITGADTTEPENSITEDVPLSTTLPNGTNVVSIQGATEPTLDIRAGTTAFATPGLTPNPILELIGNVNTNATSTSADININSIKNVNYSPELEPINGKILLTNQYAPNNLPGKIITGSIDAFGDVTIDSRGDITTYGNIDTSSFIEDGGNISLLARGTLSLDDVFVRSESSDIGKAGDITVKAQSVFLKNGAQLRSISYGSGDAGNINVNVRDILSLTGNGNRLDPYSDQNQLPTPSAIFTLAEFRHSKGNGGDINISTNSLTMKDGAEILANNFGSGIDKRAGDITIRATGKISLDGFRVRPQDSPGTGIASNVSFFGENKKAGTIDIQAASLDLTNGASIASKLERGSGNYILTGQGGNIKLNIAGDVLISGVGKSNNSGIFALTEANTSGDGGTIEVKTGGNISLSDRAQIQADNNGLGVAGTIKLIAGNTFSVDNSNITSESNNNNLDSHSAIYIEATKDSVFLNQARISTTNFGLGYAGDIIIGAHNEVSILNSSTFNPANEIKGIFSNGYLGNIYIGLTKDSSLIPQKVTFDHSFLTTSNLVEGNNQQEIFTKDAGNIIIRTLGELSLSSSNLESATYGDGGGGYIDIKARSVSLSNQSSLLADTLGTGKAGSVTVNATGGSVSLAQSSINTGSNQLTSDPSKPNLTGKGGGGDINIRADSLSVTNNSYLNASTFGSGHSGNFLITVDKAISFTDSSILNARTYGTGKAGNVNITAQSIAFSNESLIQAETFGSGNAGNLEITAQLLSLSNTSRIDAQTFGSGNAGNINIKTQSLSLTEGSRFNADTRSSGKGGNININPWNEQNPAAASVNISGYALINKFSSGLFVNTESTVTNAGAGGNIAIHTGTLSISDGGVLSAPSKSSGNGGDISVNVNNLEITGGGQILTNAYRSGAAGNIKINATDNITIAGQDFKYQERLKQLIAIFSNIKDNYDFVQPNNEQEAKRILGSINQYSGLFANTEIDSTGQGGTINIDPRQVTIKDSARISVDSQGSGVAGSLSITADRLTLDNQAKITADTNSGQGGSIALNLQDLLLFRRQSLISTTAGRQGAGGDGGAIAIKLNSNNGFIVSPSLENNDIAANAFSGSGGTIEIDAKGVIGLATLTRQELEQKLGTTDPAKLDSQYLQTNDITAISQTDPQLNGVISISSPDIDPSKGIVSLPTNANDPSQQIAQNCGAGDEKTAGQFTDVGRGGLPPKPDELLSANTVWEDIRLTANSLNTSNPSYNTTAKPPQQKAVLVMPATGWVFNDKGDVTLVSQTPKTAASWLNSSSCAVKK
ncbi:filamentous hemagglutinin N-terminal domain-containing protein [Tolypothrix sp. PCC 7910]|uniref:two-partner secretion domain-containing protein n=1 Tax=Tolypothrix sp. PCC 7910 TaxID=2099387 RepID=UPI0014278292|nr:filamentous hemagglutinin N-terminal domain-containing protein [Tolypothrix sp. PCC 7910]QIR36593.1 filamentous hemagglutinin N-terminal domain-containing protein [Tolypothrix sp. PCC 7910]